MGFPTAFAGGDRCFCWSEMMLDAGAAIPKHVPHSNVCSPPCMGTKHPPQWLLGGGLKAMTTPHLPQTSHRPEAPNPTLHPPPHPSASEPLPRAGVWPGQEPREGQCLSENPICAQQLNACPAQSPPLMGGMEGWTADRGMWWRPRKMVGSPCRPGTPSQLSPAPASHPASQSSPSGSSKDWPKPRPLSPSSLTQAPSVKSPPASLPVMLSRQQDENTPPTHSIDS